MDLTPVEKEFKAFNSGEGLDVEFSNIFSTNNKELFTILLDGSIVKSTIHIVDISNYLPYYSFPKFHIYNCKTFEEMNKNKRGGRYKASGRTDGKFYLIKKSEECYEELEICDNCLKRYNRQFNCNEIKDTFRIKEYLKYSIINAKFQRMKLDLCSIPKRYSKDWLKISGTLKKRASYICSKCGNDLSKLKKYLHVHHKDADRSNNTPENLKVLCIVCHSEEYNHKHIKNTPVYKEYIAIINKKKE